MGKETAAGIGAQSLDPSDSRFADIPTPALILDEVALDANIRHMARQAGNGRPVLRPHAKSHKCVEIARRQREAGAIGISCATLAEAEDFSAQGTTGLLITSPLAGHEKCRRFAALSERSDVSAVVDDPDTIAMLASMATARPLSVLIDVDVGQGRTGVTDGETIVALAKQIASHDTLAFAGIQAYAGHAQHITGFAERRRVAQDVRQRVAAIVDGLKREGLPPRIVTGGGTGTSALDLDDTVFTELQAGSYCLMDAEYRTIDLEGGDRLPFAQSLHVLATVVSRRPGQITIDSGTKALATNGPVPDRVIGVAGPFRFRFGGDEHGILHADDEHLPPVGARVLLAPTHCDPTVNLHSAYHVVAPGGPIAIWPIVGRYRHAA